MYVFLYGHMFSFILGKYLGTECLDHTVGVLVSFLRGCQMVFRSVFVPPSSVCVLVSPYARRYLG